MTSALLFLAAFAWFTFHAVGSLYFGDNGELLAAILTGGIPHPTGFPLFLLLTTLPGKAGTFPVNLLSSALGALSVVLTGHLAAKCFGRSAFFPAALAILGSTTLLLHASMARVYPYQLCLLLAVLWATLAFKPDRRWGLGVGFLFGLSAGTHALFLAGGVFMLVYLWRRRRETVPLLPWAAMGFFFGISLYLWIPLRANLLPSICWNHPADFHSLWNYLSQKGYDTKKFARDAMGTRLFLGHIIRAWLWEWNPLIWIFSLVGLRGIWYSRRPLVLGLGALVVFNVALLFVYGNEQDLVILYRYFLPMYGVVSLLAGVGATAVWERWSGRYRSNVWVQACALTLFGLICLSYPAWKWNDLSESDACDRYAIHFLRYLPRNATAFISGDNQVFPAAYEVLALRKRADLELIEFPGALFPPKDADGFQDDKVSYEKKRFETRGHCLFLPNERVVAPPFLCRPFGLMYRLSDSATDPSLASPPPPDWLPLHATEAEKRDPESLEALSEGYLMAAVWASDRGDRTEALDQLGKAVDLGRDSVRTLINASAQASKLDADDFSEKTLKRALEISPGHFEAHLNLGILFGKMGHYDKARRYLWEAETISPGNPTVRYYLAQIQQITGRSR